MKRNRANEQAMVWLRSMCADTDSFNAINAENCIALIHKQQNALMSLGAHFNSMKRQRDRYLTVLEEARKKLAEEKERKNSMENGSGSA